MDIVSVNEILRKAVFAMIKVGSPTMLVALIIGVVFSILQAVTQIQEQSLSFIPKILGVFLTLVFLFPYMYSVIAELTHDIFDLAVKLS